ncbi:MAG: NfeD family protein [Acidimicrobiales bacterium]
MWFGVGVVLGLAVIASVLGFHMGPHGHLAALGLGVAGAILLLVMAATGQATLLAWVLFGADVALSGGLGVLAWRGLHDGGTQAMGSRLRSILGAEGVALSELAPDGIARVAGETWSATCLNGSAPLGARLQVIDASGVRLGVWREDQPEIGFEDIHHEGGEVMDNREVSG